MIEIINSRPFNTEGKELSWAQVSEALTGVVTSEGEITGTGVYACRRKGQYAVVNLGQKALISEAFPDDYAIARELSRRVALVNKALDELAPEDECLSLHLVLGGWHLELQRVYENGLKTRVCLEGSPVLPKEASRILTGTTDESFSGLFSSQSYALFYRHKSEYGVHFSECLSHKMPLHQYAAILRGRYTEALAVLNANRPKAVVPGP